MPKVTWVIKHKKRDQQPGLRTPAGPLLLARRSPYAASVSARDLQENKGLAETVTDLQRFEILVQPVLPAAAPALAGSGGRVPHNVYSPLPQPRPQQ